ncbi:Gfo/Idh/MocA family protein [Gorillibacterium timonense]|uniref:Gfo/Idh/MocA family protein n=1 Tax=Gorillibacterium timonense TaxID=1689269 RepID=UPI00071CD7B0|nr:Gfo/Idh/MocA family oxidoreductase [Gorillibacterium timonense]
MIKVGILGTGFGRQHAALFKKLEGFEVVAIYGRDEAKLQEINESLNIHTTTDMYEIIHNKEIDLVDICLPTSLHAQWAMEALKNHKHVFCETPLSYSFAEAEEVLKLSKEVQRHVFVDLFYKFSTPHHLTINKIKNLECGQVRSFHSYNKTAPNWGNLGLPKNVTDFHTHNFDFLMEILGMPEQVASNGIDFGDESIVITTLNYPNQFAVVESYSNLPKGSPFYVGFEVNCERGSIKFDAEYGMDSKEEFVLYHSDGTKEVLTPQMQDDYEQVILHLKDCLEQGKKSEHLDMEAAMDVMKIRDAVLKSLEAKKPILLG